MAVFVDTDIYETTLDSGDQLAGIIGDGIFQ